MKREQTATCTAFAQFDKANRTLENRPQSFENQKGQ